MAVALGFNIHELKFALAVLIGINKVVKAEFIQEAIDDLTEFLKPVEVHKLPLINYSHICQNCFRDIDERDENTMCLSKDGDTKWKCRVCKPIKKDRPR